MATFYKGIEYVSHPRERIVYYKNQSFSDEADGVNSIQFRSESLDFNQSSGQQTYTISGSHYNFVNNLINNDNLFDGYIGINKNKLYTSGSVIYIPQQYFGEAIKPKSFEIIDDSTAKQIIIKDDGKGNLFSTNAAASRSATTAESSSDNYVGNIHYESGVVLLTETASWSGSGNLAADINYSEVGTDNFILNFNSTQTIIQNEIILKIKAHEFNVTGNQSIYQMTEGPTGGRTSVILDTISSSLDTWSPYATGISFYREVPSVLYNKQIDDGGSSDDESDDIVFYTPEVQPLMIAKFPRPVKIDNDGDLTIIIRYDT